MEPGIAFNTGYLMGYLAVRGIDVLPVFDDERNYKPMIDITVPVNMVASDSDTVLTRTIRVEVVS